MKTTIKDNVLHIEIPLHAPRPSATGKTLTVASSQRQQGNRSPHQRQARRRRRQCLHQARRLIADCLKVEGLKVKSRCFALRSLDFQTFRPLDL